MPTILTKKSDTPGAIPATANLTNAAGGAELAVNTADKRLFTITSGSQVVELGTNPASLTCADGSFTLLKAASASITNLTATSLVLSNLSIASANVTTLTSASATITNLLATSLTVSSGSTLNGGVVINEPGADADTRIEGDTDANLFFADASTDRIGIGTNAPTQKLTVAAAGKIEVLRSDNARGGQLFADSLGTHLVALAAGNDPLFLETLGSDGIRFLTSASEKMRLSGSGDLNLGTTGYGTYFASDRVFSFGIGGTLRCAASGTDPYVTLASNAYFSSDTNWKYINSDFASNYEQYNGTHTWSTAASGTAGNAITFTQAMTLDASGNLGVGTTSPSVNGIDIVKGSGVSTYVRTANGTYEVLSGFSTSLGGGLVGTISNHPLLLYANNAERARITAGGSFLMTKNNVIGINTSDGSDDGYLALCGAGADGSSRGGHIYLSGNERSVSAGTVVLSAGNVAGGILEFRTGADVERARITSDGLLLVGKTADNDSAGITLRGNGSGYFVKSTGAVLGVNRLDDDGELVQFFQASTQEGSISVSGNTVSYNAFAGSHWSQLQDGGKPDILRGTVMESINELCEWPDETNERLPKSKISDTAGSKKVYGVFMAWDNDWTTTNDMYVTAVGAFICRVNGSVTVQEGDLLESNGDGTARVQADDIIRSSTIGKVTSTVKTHEYDDGSYCVPTVLYCG
jgi:hypothetical protein